MWKTILVIVLVFFIIIMIKRKQNKYGDVWEDAGNMGRGACAKLKELLWGC